MIRGTASIALLLAALVPTPAQAEQTKLRIDLKWQHQPRDKDALVLMTAPVDGGLVVFRRTAISYYYAIRLNTGYACASIALLTETLVMVCTTPTGTWLLDRNPYKENAELDWVANDVEIPKGSGS